MDDCQIEKQEGDSFIKDIADFPIHFLRAYLDIAMELEIEEATPEELKTAPRVLDTGREYLQSSSLHAREARWVRWMDGRNTLSQIFQEFAGDEREIMAMINVLKQLKVLDLGQPLPQRFQKKASDIQKEAPKKEAPPEDRNVVHIKGPESSKPANPIYQVALDLDKPYHLLLKIAVDAPKTQVKIAYDQWVRKLSLDSIETAYVVPEERAIANKVFDQLTLAYSVFSDTKKRDDYLKGLSQKQKPVPSPKVLAEVHCQKAKLFIGKRKYEEAEKEIRKAMELDPEESAYLVELAALVMVKSHSRKEIISDEVEKQLKKALKMNSGNLEAFYQLGIYYKLKGDLEHAKLAFLKMNEIKQNEPRAASELRLLHKKMDQKKGESSFMKLFKKKEEGSKSKKAEDEDD
jgi:tetratricopeptide (TPR) repeat protein